MGRGCLTAMVVFVVLLIVVYLGIWHLANQRVKSLYTPEEFAEIERFLYQPLDVPESWFELPEIPEDYKNITARIESLSKQLEITSIDLEPLTRLYSGKDPSDQEWLQIEQDLKRIEPYTAQLIALSKHPAHDLGDWTGGPSDPVAISTRLLMPQVDAKILSLRARLFARQKDWQKALDNNLAMHRLAKRRSVSSLITHLVGIAITGMAADCTVALASRCDDSSSLQNALDELNRLYPQVNLNILDRAREVDLVALSRAAKREDDSIDLTPGKTGIFYSQQVMDYNLKKAQQTGQKPSSFSALFDIGRFLGFSKTINMMVFGFSTANLENARTREKVAVAQYDLGRLALASRLVQIKTGEIPTGTASFVPDYLPQQLQDPFTDEEMYRFNTQWKVFYSVGPDKSDDQNQIVYNPSNGTVSQGDIAYIP
ncbi:MAG: hypothetical protein ABIH23_30920 [bacterium]